MNQRSDLINNILEINKVFGKIDLRKYNNKINTFIDSSLIDNSFNIK